MGKLRMGNEPARMYFRRLEREAKLANQWNDKTNRGPLVQASRQGVPSGYTSIIANISIGISWDYSEWKEWILLMYKKRQRKLAYDQAHGNDQHANKRQPGNQKQTTATSSNKNITGGMTSSLAGKTTGDSKGCDSGGRWVPVKGTTYGGVGQSMDVDR